MKLKSLKTKKESTSKASAAKGFASKILAKKLEGVTDPAERINIINFAKQNEEYEKRPKPVAPKAITPKKKIVEKTYGSLKEMLSDDLTEEESKSTKGKTAEKAAEDIGMERMRKSKRD